MAKKYRVTGQTRFVNYLMRLAIRTGIMPSPAYILTVRGRKSGNLYSTPVSLVENDAERWLVAPYGEVNWVRNARAAGEVILSRGGKSETTSIEELPPEERGPILKTYFDREGFARQFTDFTPETSLEEYVEAANHHPVFKLG